MTRSRLLVLAAGGLCAGLLAACTSGSGDSEEAGATPETRCVVASSATVDAISGGLDAGLALDDVWVVRSEDYNSAFFVSARIVGASGEPIATWAVTDPEDVGDLVFSVTEPAKRNSSFSDANDSFSGYDDGVAESQDCAEIG